MIQYPMKFTVQAESLSGIQTGWSTRGEAYKQEVAMAIPPEFEGPGNGNSPEDIYAMALQNCFIATFKVFAEKSKLAFNRIQVESVLEVDRDEQGKPWMARISMHAKLTGVAQKDLANRLLERTSQSCMILNSVKTHKSFQFEVLD